MKKNGTLHVLALLASCALLIPGCGGSGGGDGGPSTGPGSLDTSFGEAGKAATNIEGHGEAHAAALQSDGKIVAAGYTVDGEGNEVFAVVRFNADGTIDEDFGNGGLATTVIGEGGDDEACGVAIQNVDGSEKIVVAGYSDNGADYDIAVVRYNDDGSRDDAFGNNGIVTTTVGETNDVARAVAVDSGNNIVVAGYYYRDPSSYTDFCVVRYDGADGTPDDTFGDEGIVTTPVSASFDEAYALAIQDDGKIVVAGGTYNILSWNFALVRYDGEDGSLDDAFGNGGIVTDSFGMFDYWASSVAVQSDGGIVIGGAESSHDAEFFALVRYGEDGSLDTDFGTGGLVITDIGDDSWVNGLAIQADGRIVAAGGMDGDGAAAFAVARYDTDGTLDASFGEDGYVATFLTGYDDEAFAMAIDPSDGSIIAAGYADDETYTDFVVARYLP